MVDERPRAASMLRAGLVLEGRFDLESLLAQGRWSEVWRAYDRERGRAVALKVLRAEVAPSEEAARRFEREVELLGALRHCNIVTLEAVGRLPKGALFASMELLEGGTLAAYLAERGALDLGELSPLLEGIASGLQAAHRAGVIHRDLKPDNIFLCGPPPWAPAAIRLLDFGLSKWIGGSRLTETGEVLGTPRYMAPEQLMAEPLLDARADLYALGVILYEALAGRPPFDARAASEWIVAKLSQTPESLQTLRPDLPPGIVAAVHRAMATSADARFPDVASFMQAWYEASGHGTSNTSSADPGGSRPPVEALPRDEALPDPEGNSLLQNPWPARWKLALAFLAAASALGLWLSRCA